MAIKLVVKTTQPVTELKLNVAGISKPIIVGIKVHPFSEVEALRQEFEELLTTVPLELAEAQLANLLETGDKLDPDFYTERQTLAAKIKELSAIREANLLSFYKQQILFLKNVTVVLPTGQDYNIADTRVVEPIESLWGSSDDALVVLLESYLEYTPFRDSLFKNIITAIFNPVVDGKEKN